jgi:hypothetical protein
VPIGQVDQLEVAAGAVHQRADRRLARAADEQVALPVPDPCALLDGGGPVVEQERWGDEPDAALVGVPAAFAQRPAGASRRVSWRLSPPLPPW